MIKMMIGGVAGAALLTLYPDASEFFVDSGIKDYLINGAISALENVK